MEFERGYAAGWNDAIAFMNQYGGVPRPVMGSFNDPMGLMGAPPASPTPSPPVKRKASAYNRRYARAFKKVAPRFKKKSGGWMKNGFKRAQREAHRLAKK